MKELILIILALDVITEIFYIRRLTKERDSAEERAKSIANIAQTIINNGELALKAVKHYDEFGNKGDMPEILQIGDNQ